MMYMVIMVMMMMMMVMMMVMMMMMIKMMMMMMMVIIIPNLIHATPFGYTFHVSICFMRSLDLHGVCIHCHATFFFPLRY